MLLELGLSSSMILRPTVQMDMTLTLKLWYPLKEKLDLTFNTPTLVSNLSCAKPISNQMQLATTA